MSPRQSPPVTSQHLTQMWSELNGRYFAGLLPPIDLVWSRRLTSSVGMFVESSRTAAPTGSGWSSPANQARDSPVPSPAPSGCPAERVWRAGDREHAGARNDSSMAVRHPEAAAESWGGFSPQDDRDESGRRPGDHHLPFVTEGSPRPGAICLALSAMRPSVPTPATDDSAASAPLRHLPGIVTGTGSGAVDRAFGIPQNSNVLLCLEANTIGLSSHRF